MTEINDFFTLREAARAHPKWFEADSYFGTTILRQWPLEGVVYFVTSEEPPHGTTTFSLRRHTPEWADTLGPELAVGLGSLQNAVQVAELAIRVELEQRLRERPDRTEYRACTVCELTQPDERPSWAVFQYLPPDGGHFIDVCETHVPTLLVEQEQPEYFTITPAQQLQAVIIYAARNLVELSGPDSASNFLAGVADQLAPEED